MKHLRVCALLAGALLLAGCAAVPDRAGLAVPQNLFDDGAFAAPSARVDAAQVFAMSPAMQRYLDQEIAPQIRRLGRQRGLVDALYSQAQLRLEYDTAITRNAAEAFDARAGNCLSLVLMTAALAKHLELPVTYQSLLGQETWSRSGDLSLVNGHVNITVAKRLIDRMYDPESEAQVRLSFGLSPGGRNPLLVPIAEQTIVAMFMNNRAAESLVQGRLADAYAYAREAIVQDPAYASGYNTLGVIYLRRGLDALAERALRLALERQADNRPALRNLARLYDTQGRAGEATALNERLARLEQDPPFRYLDLGRAAALAGDYAAARDHILREMKRDPDYHELHFWLAVALAGLGDAAGAREHLAVAMTNSTTRQEHAIYAGKLSRMQPVVHSN